MTTKEDPVEQHRIHQRPEPTGRRARPTHIEIGYQAGQVGVEIIWQDPETHIRFALSSEEARRIAYSIEEAADKAEEDEYGD
jgi:hypothetical protein